MASGTWKVFKKAKRYIGNGTITLGAGIVKMGLYRASASAGLAALAISTIASLAGEISARGGYVLGGRNVVPATGQWTVGASAGQMKWTFTAAGLVFTASGSALNNIKYAVLRNSTGAGAGKIIAFCTLSTSPFSLATPNTLTVSPSTSGLITLS